jgi:hypothetical protein
MHRKKYLAFSPLMAYVAFLFHSKRWEKGAFQKTDDRDQREARAEAHCDGRLDLRMRRIPGKMTTSDDF